MKKFFIVLCITLFSQIPVFSIEKLSSDVLPNENYLILLNTSAKTARVSDTGLLEPEIITTLYNEKNQILLKTLKSGVARLYISTDEVITMIEFNVNENNKDNVTTPKSKIIKSILKLDKIENINEKELPFELDEPPILRKLPE